MRFLWLTLAPFSLLLGQNGEVRGTVADARGGEALANVQVQLAGSVYRVASDNTGHFRIQNVPSGDYVLNVTTVGYRLVKKPFHLDAGETQEFDVALSAGTLEQSDSVDVHADPFELELDRTASPAPLTLSANDVKNLGSVLADDPLRAVQGLPGVSSNDDFEARFSIHGADFSRVGVYLDGILLHMPLHTLQSDDAVGSASAFNGDLLSEMNLYEGAFPARFGDRSAGVLDVHPRDGSRSGASFRLSTGMSYTGVVAEGPLGKSKRGSWVASARKSYLQYIIQRTSVDTSFVFGLEDGQFRLTYDLTKRNNISLNVMESFTGLDRSSVKSTLGINALMLAGYHFSLGNLTWRYAPSDHVLVTTRGAWMREKFSDTSPKNLSLGGGHYGEWVGESNLTWLSTKNTPFEAGITVREIRDAGYSNQYLSNLNARLVDGFNGTAVRSGAFLQQSWNGWENRLRLTAGGRWDRHSIDGISTFSPQAALTFSPAASTHFQFAWGQYAQFPEVSQLTSNLGNRRLLPTRSIQVTGAVEQRLGARTRLRAEFYEREDRDLLFQPLYDPRLIAGKIFTPPLNAPFTNSMRGYARGFEVFLERRSANRLSGWVSYGYGRTAVRDGVLGLSFPSDWDQRHSMNVFASYRVRPSVNLSVRSVVGSGFPMPAFLRQSGTTYFLAANRNQVRLDTYQRTDFRVNKSWTHVKWKTTLFGEVINLSNQSNYRFDSFDGYDSKSGQARVTRDKLFPILPAVGVVFER